MVATSIYLPTATGFRVYVNAAGITPAQANSWGWQINWLAVAGNESVVRKYYYAGNQRVAMHDSGTLRWLLNDHLGGIAITVSGTTESGEVRYHPFGADRYTSDTTPTSFKYTGQRQESGIAAKAPKGFPNPWLTTEVG